ncbi:MAG: DivIVA domain-containing protein [Tetrasphaera sp.]|nr:DivIVA domain-containing protein [Tetrasphaera sp.]
MVWVVLAVVAVAVVVVIRLVVSGTITPDAMPAPVRSQPDPGLPQEPKAADVPLLRFDTASRGYDIEAVDDELDRLEGVLRRQEAELAEFADVRRSAMDSEQER